ncbi:hypothetical protein Desde_4170 [Desulfitobacterium dehalogenans ATCC 51507]|uniref:Uncharacterized protein n=1 Tax=Desulfitobacterium dehalogenans (strain ATCC 51507 / DSM 9161 / JW/IU-DC1) TaxID=756499 RepID=I4AEP6_DESDJ|nr:hypothetical protein [Desulfitobacterium dehalogenans]AFM02431.1 hypothetical protein Desde_4170 [Desulfitobacterium dehalogenans ATCC 51507]
MDDRKNTAKEMKRQLWEPAGVISQTQESGSNTMDYGEKPKESTKGGQLNLEVEDVFHNRGIMENLQNAKE